MNKRNSGSDTNPLSTSSSSPQPDNKKLRQTTLPWAPKPPQPRPNDSTVSPYFASSRSPPVQDVSTAIRQGRGRGQGRGQERGQGQGRGAGEGSGEGNGGRGSPFSTSSSAFSRDNPRTLSRKNSDIPRQYFFSVPSWSRPIRKINMASTKVRHLPVMQKKACDQLSVFPTPSYPTTNQSVIVMNHRESSPQQPLPLTLPSTSSSAESLLITRSTPNTALAFRLVRL
jgi:hypothetical protein